MLGTVVKNGKLLRRGFTTGSCAAAAAKSAALALLSGGAADEVALRTPGGVTLRLEVAECRFEGESVVCGVKKDAGDDPDVTDGIVVYAAVRKVPEGFFIDGGAGVGRVTRPGLACRVGEAAVNPVPRAMIAGALREAAARCGYRGGLSAVISAPAGAALAAKTYNPRLGIVGGISILGTTGIVEPMSEAAVVDTVKVEIDARLAAGAKALLVTPGNYGRDFAKSAFGLDLDTAVLCSNYIGDALDYAVYRGVKELLLIGHAGKLIKVAAGVMNTHSRVADCRAEVAAAHAALCGATACQVRELMGCATVDAMHALLARWGLAGAVWNGVLGAMSERIGRRTGGACRVEAVVFTNEAGVLAQTEGAAALAAKIGAEAAGGADTGMLTDATEEKL